MKNLVLTMLIFILSESIFAQPSTSVSSDPFKLTIRGIEEVDSSWRRNQSVKVERNENYQEYSWGPHKLRAELTNGRMTSLYSVISNNKEITKFSSDGSINSVTQCSLSSQPRLLGLTTGQAATCITVTKDLCNRFKSQFRGASLQQVSEAMKTCQDVMEKMRPIRQEINSSRFKSIAEENFNYIRSHSSTGAFMSLSSVVETNTMTDKVGTNDADFLTTIVTFSSIAEKCKDYFSSDYTLAGSSPAVSTRIKPRTRR